MPICQPKLPRKCICEICTCGRHRCPHRPNLQIGQCDTRCLLSEYRSTYREHPVQMQKSFKPAANALCTDQPLEDKTTNRVDYIAHQVERPKLHQPDPYKEPSGEQDHMTSYVRDYPGKCAPPAKAIKHDGQRQVLSKFEGEPTYRADYRKWNLDGRPKRHEGVAWIPPQDEFKGISTFTSDYQRYCQPPRQSMKPKEAPNISCTPFDSATGYRESYIRHPLQEKFLRKKEVYKPSGIPLDGLSTFKKDYQGAHGSKAESCKPAAQAFASDAPLEDLTTFRNDYRKWPTEKPFMRVADQYKKPEGDMDMNTTHNITYKQFPLQPHLARRPASATQKLPGCFDGTTNYSMDYQKWDLSQRSKPMMKPEYCPNLAPFEGISTNKSHYIPHPLQHLKSFKPAGAAICSTTPFENATMYRMEYTPKKVERCPAAAIDSDLSCYEFVEVDNCGHKVYQQVFENVVCPPKPMSTICIC